MMEKQAIQPQKIQPNINQSDTNAVSKIAELARDIFKELYIIRKRLEKIEEVVLK